ncbi:MAG: helix-turn-helix domain-containing protein [Chitinophagaceae bacterium]
MQADSSLSSAALAAKTGASLRTIVRWVNAYATGGATALLSESRGGDHRSGLDETAKQKIKARLSDPKDAFTSYGQAQEWINNELGTDKKYHAVNK